jgi:C4-dicarboxylate transporter
MCATTHGKQHEQGSYKILQTRQKGKGYYVILPLFQIIKRFGFSRYIAFSMYLDIVYIYVHSKSYVPTKAKTSYNLGRIE